MADAVRRTPQPETRFYRKLRGRLRAWTQEMPRVVVLTDGGTGGIQNPACRVATRKRKETALERARGMYLRSNDARFPRQFEARACGPRAARQNFNTKNRTMNARADLLRRLFPCLSISRASLG